MSCQMCEIFLEHPVLFTCVLLFAAFWLYSYFTLGVCHSKARMDGKTVIITGCDSGIGRAAAHDLARRGARVIMACVRVEQAHKVRDELVKSTKNPDIVVKPIDLSLMSSVRRFAKDINMTEPRLDVLIHNAGVVTVTNHVTKEGLNLMWATNHFGPFLLTHLLIDLLKKTPKSRVVFVASMAHWLPFFANVDPSHPNPTERLSLRNFYHLNPFSLYSGAKLANVLLANEMAKRLEGTGVTVNSLHPGFILTGIWNITLLPMMVFKPLTKSVEQGAQTTIYLAVSEEVEGVSGKYFSDCRESTPSKKTKDSSLAEKYWKVCEELVQLTPSDPHI